MLGDVAGAHIDLDVDLGRLGLRCERAGGVRILERQVLGVLRQYVELGWRSRLGGGTVTVGHETVSWRKKGRLTGRVANIALPSSTRTRRSMVRHLATGGKSGGLPGSGVAGEFILNN